MNRDCPLPLPSVLQICASHNDVACTISPLLTQIYFSNSSKKLPSATGSAPSWSQYAMPQQGSRTSRAHNPRMHTILLHKCRCLCRTILCRRMCILLLVTPCDPQCFGQKNTPITRHALQYSNFDRRVSMLLNTIVMKD